MIASCKRLYEHPDHCARSGNMLAALILHVWMCALKRKVQEGGLQSHLLGNLIEHTMLPLVDPLAVSTQC